MLHCTVDGVWYNGSFNANFIVTRLLYNHDRFLSTNNKKINETQGSFVCSFLCLFVFGWVFFLEGGWRGGGSWCQGGIFLSDLGDIRSYFSMLFNLTILFKYLIQFLSLMLRLSGEIWTLIISSEKILNRIEQKLILDIENFYAIPI